MLFLHVLKHLVRHRVARQARRMSADPEFTHHAVSKSNKQICSLTDYICDNCIHAGRR